MFILMLRGRVGCLRQPTLPLIKSTKVDYGSECVNYLPLLNIRHKALLEKLRVKKFTFFYWAQNLFFLQKYHLKKPLINHNTFRLQF